MRTPSKSFDRELQVGLFVFLALLVIAAFSLKITDTPLFRQGTSLVVYLDDATGLFKDSKVKMAGINVGVIRKIELENAKAKITILVDSEYKIPEGAIAVPRPLGILGDKYIEIEVPEDKRMPNSEGGTLKVIEKGEGFSFNLLDLIIAPAYSQQVLKSGDVLPAKNSAATVDDLVRQMGTIGEDVKSLTQDMKSIVSDNKDEINQTLKSISSITRQLDETLKGARGRDFKKDLQELSKSVNKVNETLDNIREISEKVNKGEGTLGKLVNDSQTIDHVNRTLLTINDAVDRARRTELILDLNPNYMPEIEESKTYLGLMIKPRKSYGYFFQLVQDPVGKTSKTTTKTSVDGGKPTETVTEKTKEGDFKYSFQFMKKIWSTQFRLGLFESTGGLAVDQDIVPDILSVSLEAFDFGRDEDNPRVRAYATLSFYRYFYIRGGTEDLIAENKDVRGDSYFAGIGLRFTDNDLKSVFIIPGVP